MSPLVITLHAFPPSHCDVGLNDSFVSQVFACTRSWKGPLILTGDFNVKSDELQSLCLSSMIGLHRISGNQPTTSARVAGVAKLPRNHPLTMCLGTLLSLIACLLVESIVTGVCLIITRSQLHGDGRKRILSPGSGLPLLGKFWPSSVK